MVERRGCPEYIKIKKTRGSRHDVSEAPPPPAVAIAFVISITNADAATVAAAAAVPSPFQHIKES